MSEPEQQSPAPPRLIWNVAWSVFRVLTPALLTFLLTPILVRHLGEDGYGLLAVLLTFGTLYELSDLGLGEATVRYTSHYHARGDLAGMNRTVGATLTVHLLVGGGLAVLLALFARPILSWFAVPPALQAPGVAALRVLCLGFLFGAAGASYSAVLQGMARFDWLARAHVGVSVLYTAAAAIVVLNGGRLVALAVVLAARQVLIFLVCYVAARRLRPGLVALPWPTRAGLREVFGYGLFSFVNNLIGMASAQIDKLILGSFFNLQQVSYLAVPMSLFDRGSSCLSAASNVLFPRFGAGLDPALQRRVFLFSSWGLAVTSLAIYMPTVILMHDLLSLWISPTFADASAVPAQVIAACLAWRNWPLAYFEYLKGTGRIRLLTLIFLGSSLVSAAIAPIFVLHWGLLGAAYRLWAMGWVGLVVGLLVWQRLLEGRWPALVRLWLEPLAVALAVGAGGWWLRRQVGIVSWPVTLGLWFTLAGLIAGGALALERLRTGTDGPAGYLLARAGEVVARLRSSGVQRLF